MDTHTHYLLNEKGEILASHVYKMNRRRPQDLTSLITKLIKLINPSDSYTSLYLWESHDPTWVCINKNPNTLVAIELIGIIDDHWNWLRIDWSQSNCPIYSLPEEVKTFLLLMNVPLTTSEQFEDIPF